MTARSDHVIGSLSDILQKKMKYQSKPDCYKGHSSNGIHTATHNSGIHTNITSTCTTLLSNYGGPGIKTSVNEN